ncbi:aliphatic sulfonate ABC transporter substrate-binding protein [Bacillus paramycoides]|uniref:aliphatic sulfonate ABC transporter substrate-binding protein n=1 Tax=Bacillus paramycoides TaxID=2026194 RepID=UPI002E1C759B|nr:aliphatic sulfonate ABC transporter substrate-binding protein [Bacillus paramycoides]MED0972751.1 aliphatic sulfonate ABC transporter substrate-binding protein [Bacillus paramycoides]MED1107964.1 aliphatic sulfonate ABC transporter substrate-binding protein [Bacillus paramycoides]
MKRNTFFITVIAIFSFLLILTGCGAGNKVTAGQTGDKVVKIGYQKGNTLNILKESGYLEKRLKKEGYKVEWKLFASGGLVLEALATGNVDYGHAADGSGIVAQATNKPIVYVGADKPNPEGVGIMTANDSGITKVEELKGKKIAVAKGGNHHYLTVLALEKAGIKLEEVQFVYVKDASEGRAVFETKQVDAIASWDPFFAGLENDLKPITLTDGVKDYPNRTFYYSNTNFSKKHPELIKIILEETNKSDLWANDNKKEVVQLLAKTLGLKEEILKRAVDRRQYGVDNISEDIIQPQQKQADVFYRIGLIPNKINVKDVMPIQNDWKPNLDNK